MEAEQAGEDEAARKKPFVYHGFTAGVKNRLFDEEETRILPEDEALRYSTALGEALST